MGPRRGPGGGRPTPAEVLEFIAAEEPLEHTLRQFPMLDPTEVRGLLHAFAAAARTSEERQLGASRGAAQLREPVRSVAPPTPPPARAAGQEARPQRSVPSGAHRRLQVFSDGAARGNPGPAGAGAVLFAPDGTVVERLGRYLGPNTNNHAEYMGLLLGLERALELGAREVDVFADSELMIRQLQGRYKVKAENLRPLFAEATALLKRFDRYTLAHVRREQNGAADEMSNRAIDERM